MSDIVFMDTETLGLQIDSPIWEFAAIRRKSLGGHDAAEKSLHLFIRHHAAPWLAGFPEEFAADYKSRYDDAGAVDQLEAAKQIAAFLDGRPHVVGAVPSFDTARIAHQLLRPHRIAEPWHYHLIDIENVVVGYLFGLHRGRYGSGSTSRTLNMPWKSDELSRAVGVDPEKFDRHTAMGDVLWAKAQWDAVTA